MLKSIFFGHGSFIYRKDGRDCLGLFCSAS